MRGYSSRSLLFVFMVLCVGLLWQSFSAVEVEALAQDAGQPGIQVSKKRCEGRDAFPIFVESHCVDVPDASFALKDPGNIHVKTLSNGEEYAPDDRYFAGSNLWTLEDLSDSAPHQGVRALSCLESMPGSNWHSSVPMIAHAEDDSRVLLDWMFVSTGVSSQAYQPSLDCIWFELPELSSVPSVLSLQVFTAEAPYLHWTERTGDPLPNLNRGESGDNLEASMVMTNTNTGEVYSFAADEYGQVLVPGGTYSLVETLSGVEEFFSMRTGETTLVEVGLSAPVSNQPDPMVSAQVRAFSTGVFYCDAIECSPVVDAVIHYESMDGSVRGYCVTELIETPNGFGAWCDYEYVEGMPTVLTLDESTLPVEWIVTSENPQTYLVPENPDGPLGPVFFQVGPA